MRFAAPGGLHPATKVGGQGVEVEFESVTAEYRDVRTIQSLLYLMDELVGQLLGTRTNYEGRNKFSQCIYGHPEPQVMFTLPGGRAQFVKLDVRESK